jgi:Uma2 family endonuclease
LDNPTEKILFVYTLVDGKYIGLPTQTEGESITSCLFLELSIAIDAIFNQKI